MTRDWKQLLAEVASCDVCRDVLPHEPRPVVQLDPKARVLIAGQAPGRRVHESGIPFDDPSGDRLRDWLGVDRTTFYDARRIAILPMGFCYPGTGKSGDLPPRPECVQTWRGRLLPRLHNVELTLVLGRYALDWHLKAKRNLTETVRAWREYTPDTLPLPHPSPRNRRWFSANPWFEQDVVPWLRERVAALIA